MDFTVFVESLHHKLLLLKKVARNIAFTFLLVSLLIPISFQIVSTQAHNTDSINSNTKVKVEKVMKDNTRESREMTLAEFNADEEFTSLSKSNFNQTDQIKQTNFNLSPDIIEQIEAQKGVVYEGEKVVVNPYVLANLGYSLKQIESIQNLITHYNQTSDIKSLDISGVIQPTNQPEFEIGNLMSGGVRAYAICQEEYNISYHWWGVIIRMNGCGVNSAKWYAFLVGSGTGAATLSPCAWFCAFLGTYYAAIAPALEFQNGQCDGKGAELWIAYSTAWSTKSIC